MATQAIYDAVIQYNLRGIADLVQAELDSGTDIAALLKQGLISPMDRIGQLFSEGELFIPEMLMAAKAMKNGLEVLRPHLTQTASKPKDAIIIGTVHGDLHDIGKNLVTMMLEGAGFEVTDLGVNVETQKFIDAVNEHDAKIVGLSALLTTTMPAMKETVAALKKEIPGIKIMVGGAPVTQTSANKIGAEGYGQDAPSAVKLAREFI